MARAGAARLATPVDRHRGQARQRRSAGEGADDLGDATHPGVGRLRVHHGTRSALIGRRLLAAAEESAQARRGLWAVDAAAPAPPVGWEVTEPLTAGGASPGIGRKGA